MAQNVFTRRSNSNGTRTYPGTAARLLGSTTETLGPPPAAPALSLSETSVGGSIPTVFSRPLSRSQLTPVHPDGLSGVVSRGAATARVPQTSPSSSSSLMTTSPGGRAISLDQPRPNSERHRNLYLGAPLPHPNQKSSPSWTNNNNSGGVNSSSAPVRSNINSISSNKLRLESGVTAAEQVRLPSKFRSSSSKSNEHHSSDSIGSHAVVTSQPSKRTTFDGCGDHGDGGGSGSGDGGVKLAESSIICPCCRKCRCEACATPRALPSKWICSKSVHCGPEPVLDYVTCLCCVKAMFYHCGKNHEPDGGVMCADNPCSCAPHRKFWRWGCMGAMSLVLPCLCLYWPCKGVIRVVDKVYQKYHSNGCTCRPSTSYGESVVTETSEDEDRGSSHSSHPPAVPPRMGTTKLLPKT